MQTTEDHFNDVTTSLLAPGGIWAVMFLLLLLSVWTLTVHFALHKPTDTDGELNSLSRRSWVLLLAASLLSGGCDGNELPALCSKTGQGWVQAKARRSLHTEPSPRQKSAQSCAWWWIFYPASACRKAITS